MSTLQQTLYAASGRETFSHDLISGTAPTYPLSQTPAQTHDGSNATRDQVRATGDGDLSADVFAGVRWTMDTCTFSGTIEKVVVRLKAVGADTYGGQAFDVFPWWADSERGTTMPPQTVDDSGAVWVEWTHTTNPLTSGAWTAAAINAYKWGWTAHLLTADESMSTYGSVTGYEFELQVWGTNPTPQTSTPSSTQLTASSSPATGLPGVRVVSPAAVAVTARAVDYPEAMTQSAPRNPEAVTPLAVRENNGSVLATLRDRMAALRDGDWSTFSADARTGPVNAGMSVQFSGLGMNAVDGTGDIDYIVFHALARVQGEHGGGEALPVVTVPRWNVGGQSIPTSAIPSGAYGVAYADVQSDPVSTRDGTHPWTWDTIYAGTSLHSLSCHVVYNGIGVPVELDVCEVWAEVVGPIGVVPDAVRKRVNLGALRQLQPLRSTLTE